MTAVLRTKPDVEILGFDLVIPWADNNITKIRYRALETAPYFPSDNAPTILAITAFINHLG